MLMNLSKNSPLPRSSMLCRAMYVAMAVLGIAPLAHAQSLVELYESEEDSPRWRRNFIRIA